MEPEGFLPHSQELSIHLVIFVLHKKMQWLARCLFAYLLHSETSIFFGKLSIHVSIANIVVSLQSIMSMFLQ
jgi:hypothetical protein